MSTSIRMESTALQIASAVFEKLGNNDPVFLGKCLRSIFTCLNYYRNYTRDKLIPITITKAMHACFSTFMINHGVTTLIEACDSIQSGILNMVLTSEGDKIKHVIAPERDRKYAIVAYTNLVSEQLVASQSLQVIQIILSALTDLCAQN